MMASLGQRLIGEATEKTVAGIFECLKKQLESTH
jgi:carbon monoxide dehydrogenase subunit G